MSKWGGGDHYDEHVNREFKALEAIRKAVKCNLELIVITSASGSVL